jgi:hypothetical protein
VRGFVSVLIFFFPTLREGAPRGRKKTKKGLPSKTIRVKAYEYLPNFAFRQPQTKAV